MRWRALNHPGNSAGDNNNEGLVRVWERPQDLSRILDDMQTRPALNAAIDFRRVAAVGHSSGGYTALALAGGVYQQENMRQYCEGPDRGPDCDLAVDVLDVDFSDAALSYRDDRVHSVVALAPAVGPAIERGSLEAVSIPVLIVAARDDGVLPYAMHARYYADQIPRAELWELPVGGHFLFMQCNPVTYIVDWFVEDFALCAEARRCQQSPSCSRSLPPVWWRFSITPCPVGKVVSMNKDLKEFVSGIDREQKAS